MAKMMKKSMMKKSAMKSMKKSAMKKSGGMKRKVNEYFRLMLAAKKSGASSFKYNGSTYVAKKHGHLMVYKKK